MKGPALISGGSSGIGLALAMLLAERGHDLALVARDAGRLERARSEIKRRFQHVRIETFAADVGDRSACTAAVEAAVASMGVPCLAVANAGMAVPGEFLDQPLDEHVEQMRINYLGALYFARAAAHEMARQGGGRLVFISSGAGLFGIYGYAAYAPSKFAVRALAEVLRIELAPHGIGVTVCYPPDTDTPQLISEARTKPAVTKIITGSGGLWTAEAVAKRILAGAERGQFVVAPGFQLAMLVALHSLIGPALRLWQSRVVRKHRRAP